MQVSESEPNDLIMLSKEAAKYPIDVLYFADSLGCMIPNQINELVNIFKNNTNLPIGIHAHNNMQLAMSNTITSLMNGVTLLDATLLGMGRGAGNLKTELLLTQISKTQKINFNKLTCRFRLF